MGRETSSRLRLQALQDGAPPLFCSTAVLAHFEPTSLIKSTIPHAKPIGLERPVTGLRARPLPELAVVDCCFSLKIGLFDGGFSGLSPPGSSRVSPASGGRCRPLVGTAARSAATGVYHAAVRMTLNAGVPAERRTTPELGVPPCRPPAAGCADRRSAFPCLGVTLHSGVAPRRAASRNCTFHDRRGVQADPIMDVFSR